MKIGDQFWLKENLRCTSYSDGTPIPRVQGNNWGTYSAGAYCYYGEDSTTAHIYGYLYNYSAAAHGNLCPPGWHVPSIDEWNTLIAYAGGSTVAGGKLRQKGRMFWGTTESCVTDEYGFSALPGGIRGPGNTSFSIKDKGFWWSATSYNNNYADVCTIASNGCNIINTDPAEKHCGCSIRCVKDN